jgi:simple sugar transport system permease protein
VSGPEDIQPGPDADPIEGAGPTVATRLTEHLQGGGIVAALLTIIVAFAAGGVAVALTGHDPWSTYRAIFNGSGLNWLIPWSADRELSAINLQQTLIIATPLALLGLAVAYAFRAGLFNIGGQGQYIVGAIFAVWVGGAFDGMPGWLHVILAMLAGSLAGGVWAGIAGLLRATTGANEVITTIMLNWIAIWVGVYLFSLGGPLQDPGQPDVPISKDIAANAHLPVFWGDPELQGLHIGLFIAIAAGVVFWIVLHRSTRGYEARAVGLNPEAARASGVNVGATYVRVMFLCGVFAGLAGTLDVLGWQFHLNTNDIQTTQLGFLGIAVALLGRNTAVGTFLAALLFGALVNGTSVRNLDPDVFEPDLAFYLTTIIQGLVVLLATIDVFVVVIWKRLLNRRRRGGAPGTAPAGEGAA